MVVLTSIYGSLQHATSLVLATVIQQPLVYSATVAAGLFAYYCFVVVQVPELAVKQGSAWHKFLMQHVPVLKEKYWSLIWCYEARFQTVLASLLSLLDPPLKYKREILYLSDGGQLCLDWITEDGLSFVSAVEERNGNSFSNGSAATVNGCKNVRVGNQPTERASDPQLVDMSSGDEEFPITEKPVLIVLPGLTGSSESEYVKDFVRKGIAAGYRCLVFNNRGRGGVELKTPRTYCGANCDDFAEAVEQIAARYRRERARKGLPCSKEGPVMVAIGISLGGMILGHYISDKSEIAAKRLVAAVGVSVPYNVFIGTESLEKPWLNRALNCHLAKCLVNSVVELKDMLQHSDKWNYDYVLKSETIRDFDARFTAQQFGFADVNDYYATASLHDKLHNVKVPYLGLSAQDDPFQPRHGLPIESALGSEHVALAVTSRGGHISFLEGVRGGCWAARVVGELLTAVVKYPHILTQIKQRTAS